MVKIAVIAPYEEFGKEFMNTFQIHDEKVHKDTEEESDYEVEIIVEYDQKKSVK